MTSVLQILRAAEAQGVTFDLVGNHLKVGKGKILPDDLLKEILERKTAIMELLDRDQQALAASFLPLQPGETYERQVGPSSHVFLSYEGECWKASRISWRPGQRKPVSEKVIAEDHSFAITLLKAKRYVSDSRNHR